MSINENTRQRYGNELTTGMYKGVLISNKKEIIQRAVLPLLQKNNPECVYTNLG